MTIKRPYLIGITGGSGTGKTALSHHLATCLTPQPALVIPLDAYYLQRTRLTTEMKGAVNYDVPEAFDVELLMEHLRCLARGRSIERPIYNFREHVRTGTTERVKPGHFVIVEGLFTLYWTALRTAIDLSIFIVADDATSFTRRLARDTRERGRTVASVRTQWDTTVLPMYKRHIEPTQQFANLVVNGTDTLEKSAGAILAHVPPSNDILPKSRRS